MARRILITGGSGALGCALVRRLIDEGFFLRALVAPGDEAMRTIRHAHAELRHFDGRASDAFDRACDGVSAVVHFGASLINRFPLQGPVTEGATGEAASAALRAGVRHFVLVSSAAAVYPASDLRAAAKRRAEEIVKESRLSWTIVRPALIYGKSGGPEFDSFVAYLRRFPAVPFIGAGRAVKRPVFLDDVADGLAKLVTGGTGAGALYNFSGGERITVHDFAVRCLALMETPRKPIVPLPVWFCRALAAALKALMRDPPLTTEAITGVISDADLDPSSAVRELGFAARRVSDMLPGCFPREGRAPSRCH
jgi:NADH dehydrogenase